jgi:hypothetical protein
MTTKLVLSNPRGKLSSAHIVPKPNGTFTLSVVCAFDSVQEDFVGLKSVASAKRLFSNNYLTPRYFGDNLWVSIQDKTEVRDMGFSHFALDNASSSQYSFHPDECKSPKSVVGSYSVRA